LERSSPVVERKPGRAGSLFLRRAKYLLEEIGLVSVFSEPLAAAVIFLHADVTPAEEAAFRTIG
jgi:hypothetical protein